MGLIQRVLARFGYIRIADYGLVLTPYGVVPINNGWGYQSLPQAPMAYPDAVAPVAPVPYAEPPLATAVGYGPVNSGPRPVQSAQSSLAPVVAQGTQQVNGAGQRGNSEPPGSKVFSKKTIGSALTPADSDNADGNTTHALPLEEFDLPLAVAPESANSPESAEVVTPSWERPGLATVVVSPALFTSGLESYDDEKTLFSDPPVHEPRSPGPVQG